MPKVLFIANIGLFFSKFLLPHADHFRKMGWQVDAAAADVSRCEQCLEHFDQVFDIEWTRNPLDPKNHFFQAIRQVQELIEREGYDIVHVHTPTPAFITRLALRNIRGKGKPKVIYTAHGFHFHPKGHPLKNFVFRSLEKMAGAWTDHLVVMNEEDYEAANRHNIVAAENLWYMPGIGVDLDRYATKGVMTQEVKDVRAEMGIRPDQPLFLMAAEFIPRKRHKDALLAFARLQNPEAHLAFAGHGKLFEQTRQLATQLGVADRVHFLGWRQDMPTLIRAANATVLTSEQEGLPRAIMESFCLGVPVIGTNIRGAHELIREGCGFMVEVGDIQALTQSMRWVIDFPERAKEMGIKGRERMKVYDLRHILRLHEQLYTKVLYGIPSSLAPRGLERAPAWDLELPDLPANPPTSARRSN